MRFQVLHTPNVQFEIHQLALNPSGKLLAVAGAFQVAVVVLPRPGFTRLVPATIDCKYALLMLMLESRILRLYVKVYPSRAVLSRFYVCSTYSQSRMASVGRSRFDVDGHDR